MRIRRVTALFLAFLMIPQGVLLTEAQEPKRPVKLEGKELLPLRVLARPFSNVYQNKDNGSQVVMANVPVFQPFYVYSQPSAEELERETAWYEVGTDNRGKVIGWMQAKDVFEWKQTMCLAFTHPDGRSAVLMFDRRGTLDDLIRSPSEERVKKASEIYRRIEDRQVPADFPVISIEPKKAIDISKQFYLLPILNFERISLDGREARLLRLAAATSAGADSRERTDIRTDSSYLKQATVGATVASREVMQRLKIDVVWVMDTTVSMRPYIEKTLEVAKQVSRQIGQSPELAEALRFGVWGYRDSAADIPGIGYTTFNYTQELQPLDRFIQTLSAVEVTKVDSVDYPEDLFSGVDDAIRKTRWDADAIRILVLVGDAPGHELGHKWNLSGQNEKTLRAIADDDSVYLFAFQVKEPKARQFHEAGERQLRTLSQNRGMSGNSAYWSTSSDDLAGFASATAELTKTLTDAIKRAKSGSAAPQTETQTVPDQSAVTEIKPVSVKGEGRFDRDAGMIIDRDFAERGSAWNGEKCVSWTDGSAVSLVIDLGDVFQIDHLKFQVDSNDEYAIEISSDGTHFSPFLLITGSVEDLDKGMVTMTNQPDAPTFVGEQSVRQPSTRYLRIRGLKGEDGYAVSEVQVFGHKAQEAIRTSAVPSASGGESLPERKGVEKLADQMIRAAMVEWIGAQSDAKAPRDIIAWAIDKDLIKPAVPSMEVRLLINKRQLDSLKMVLTDVMAAGRRGQLGGEDFFSALQATSATAARDPNQIKNARSVSHTGLIPEFLVGLPYTSRIMDLTNELWGGWSIDEQDQFLSELEAQMKAYQAIHDTPEGWIALNQGDDPDEHVYPISMELLP